MSSMNPIDRVFEAIVPRAVDAIDINEVVDQVDMNHVIEQVDMNALLQRVDIEGIIDRVDIDALIQRVDVQGIIDRVDIDALLDRIDIEGLIDRVDIASLVKRAGIDDIVSNASRGVIARMLDLVRRQLVGLDAVLIGAANKVFRRPSEQATVRDGTVTGRLAGGVTRFAAYLIDVFTISVAYSVVVAVGVYLVELVSGKNVSVAGHAWLSIAGYVTLGFLYYWIGLSITGRSVGKGLIGLRVVCKDGEPITPGRAAVRTLVYPFSFILGLGLIPIVTGKRRRALHDWAAGDTVLYDWGDRPAELPAPLTAWVRRRTGEPEPSDPVVQPADAEDGTVGVGDD